MTQKCNTNLIIGKDKSVRKQKQNTVREVILRKQNNFAILYYKLVKICFFYLNLKLKGIENM